MPDFTESLITGLFVRTFLYGVYLILLVHCLRWLFFEDEGWILRSRVNRLMAIATLLVFALATGNVVIWFCRVFNIVRDENFVDNGLILVSNALENATTLLVDAILIYRCWLVYNKSWRVIFIPIVFWLSNIGLFISYSYKTTTGKTEQLLFVVLYVCNIVITLYATTAIVYQILRVAKSSDLHWACYDLVQCGLPYVFANILSLVIMEKQPQSIAFPLSCAMNAAVCGIVFNLILIRAGLHRTDTQVHEQADGWESLSLRFAVPYTTGEHDVFDDSEHRTRKIALEKLP